MLYSIVGLIVIIIDQATKFWVSNTLFGTDVVKFIPGVISLVNVHNDGAAFSFLSGSGARIYFIIATGVFVILVIIALATNFISGRLARWSLVLVAAGGLGNMIDRIIYGYVQDMFKVELFNFAIFNVADVFITVFAILFALSMIFGKPDDDGDFEDEEEYEEEPKKEKAPRLRRKDKAAAAAEDAPEEAAEKKPAARSARKARQDKYEKEYEEYREQQLAAMRKKNADPAPAVPAAPEQPKLEAPAQEEDPFAAWERANARAEAGKTDSYAGRTMDRPAPQPAEKAKPAPQPAAAAKPAPVPAAEKPKAAEKPAVSDDFDLDDILAEFR